MTQCERILDYLSRHDRIDPWTAWRELGIARLAARIHDLRRAGVPLVRETVRATNRYGEPVSYASYRLGCGYDKHGGKLLGAYRAIIECQRRDAEEGTAA